MYPERCSQISVPLKNGPHLNEPLKSVPLKNGLEITLTLTNGPQLNVPHRMRSLICAP